MNARNGSISLMVGRASFIVFLSTLIDGFADVKAILFVVNLAGYDLVLFEDNSQNRMHEALDLFSQIVNKPHFRSTPVFLFLNKKDLFEQQIRQVGLEKCFPDYKGDNTVSDAMNFVADVFRSKMPAGNDQFQVRFSPAAYAHHIMHSYNVGRYQ